MFLKTGEFLCLGILFAIFLFVSLFLLSAFFVCYFALTCLIAFSFFGSIYCSSPFLFIKHMKYFQNLNTFKLR